MQTSVRAAGLSQPAVHSGRTFLSRKRPLLHAELHIVRCPYCAAEFDLFAARWCAHQGGDASKVCPHCTRCLCEHPAYEEPHFWKEAPEAFRRRGFQRLFLFYL